MFMSIINIQEIRNSMTKKFKEFKVHNSINSEFKKLKFEKLGIQKFQKSRNLKI